MIEEVLLIDDDAIDNETHRRVISKTGKVKKITIHHYADEALEYLRSSPRNNISLIFLDVNMPRMNGFEFMKEYEKLAKEQKAERVVIMLTTSVHPDDISKASAIQSVAEFMQKPLTLEAFHYVLETKLGVTAM